MTLQIHIKKLNPNAVIPAYAHDTDAGMDIVATSKKETHEQIIYGTGLAMEIPKGYVGLIFPRSSICKTSLSLTNSVGVIDSGYRGEIKFVFQKNKPYMNHYEVGDRIGQIIIMPYPAIEFKEVETLNKSDRGDGGYGSTGK